MSAYNPNPSMARCVECGEDVPGSECYDDMGEIMHAIGVTGIAEPHETGLSDWDQFIQAPYVPPETPDFRSLVVRDISAILVSHYGLAAKVANERAERLCDRAIEMFEEATK